MADLETLQTRLIEARTAMHNLATGTRVVEVWRDGRRISYQSGNSGHLQAYIDALVKEIDALTAAATDLPRRRFIPVAFR